MAAVPQQEPAFVVAGEETLNKFDAPFVDRKWGQSQTTTFFLGEPVVYQAKNMSAPVLTHISHIGHGYFVCAHSRTER